MATQVTRFGPSIADAIGSQAASNGAVFFDDSLDRESRWAETARRLVSEHAGHDHSVILQGESGSGRKFLASLIHRYSRRREGPFVTVTLAITTTELARRVLFGSDSAHDESPDGEKGLLELAAGGTIYIDGALDRSSDLAADVARFIDIAGINRDEKSTRILFGGRASNGGYPYRNSMRGKTGTWERIHIPALRERRDDIQPLAAHLVKQRCQELRKEVRTISQEVVTALRNYDWPRNVSELKSLVNHLVNQSVPPSLDTSLLPSYLTGSSETKRFLSSELDLEAEVRQFEMDLIRAALRQSRGYQNKAARLLRLRPTTLFMKIKRYGIEVEDFR